MNARVSRLTVAPRGRFGELQDARIYFDEKMIPHIFAESDGAAFFALGYTHVLTYPVGALTNLQRYSGRYAEAVGQDGLGWDHLMHLWEVEEVCREQEAALLASKPELHELLAAYVRGLNEARSWWASNAQAITELVDDDPVGGAALHFDPVPKIFDREKPYQVHPRQQIEHLLSLPITLGHVFSLSLALSSGLELYSGSGLPPPAYHPLDAPGDDQPSDRRGATDSRSNGWVVRLPGEAPFTHSDTHQPFNTPAYRNHFVHVTGKDYRAAGVSMPGLPYVYLGHNDNLSWLFTGVANAAYYAGRIRPITRNVWRLPRGPGPRYFFGGQPIALRIKQLDFRFWDGQRLVPDPSNPHWFVYMPAESPQLRDYPVTKGFPPGQLEYEQAAFRYAGNPCEFFVRLGMAQDIATAEALAREGKAFLFGEGINLLLADSAGSMKYVLLSKVPRQGPGARSLHPWTSNGDQRLDGRDPSQRWELANGSFFHAFDELPQVRVAGSLPGGRVWINNNVTPDLVEEPSTINPATFPDYMVWKDGSGTPLSISTWRQVRARELLQSPGNLEDAGVDLQDRWMVSMWPFFELRAVQLGGSSLLGLRAFINAHKAEHGADFLADPESRVMPFTALLQGYYLSKLEGLLACPQANLAQCRLGRDPLLQVSPTILAQWNENRDAIDHALQQTATLWEQAVIANKTLLEPILRDPACFQDAVTPEPWGPANSVYRASTEDLRWGMTSFIVVTPHFIRPFPVEQLPLNRLDLLVSLSLHSAACPREVPSIGILLPSGNYQSRFHSTPRPAVYPGAGTEHSMFVSTNAHQGVVRYDQALYPPLNAVNPSPSTMLYVPLSAGSQVIFSVQLQAGAPPACRVLAALGATEVTTTIRQSGNGPVVIDREDRFRPSSAFAQRSWYSLPRTEAQVQAESIRSLGLQML